MEKEGIPKLEKREECDYENEPLLEYVVEMLDISTEDCKAKEIEDEFIVIEPPFCPRTFAEYYLNGEIDISMEKDYLTHSYVQNTLEAFELDRDKFWYFCLMVKDMVRGYTEDTYPIPSTPREDLQKLLDGIMKMKGQGCCYENNMELTLKVKDTEKKYDKKITITNGQTIYWLGSIIRCYLDDHLEANHLDQIWHTPTPKTSPIHEKEIWKVAFFHKYMKWFLEKHLEGKTVKEKIMRDEIWSDGVKIKLPQPIPVFVDTSKQNLIARLIYILGISKKDGYKNATGLLHNNLYGEYINPTPKNHNSRYFIRLTSLEM